MDQVDTTIFERFPRRFTPVNILAPFDARRLDRIKATKVADSLTEDARPLPVKELHQPAIHVPATNNGWNEHPHEV
jgi:hypothetical protein